MLKCYECGWVGDSSELRAVQESRGEFWGIPCSETVYYCPCCGSEYIDEDDGKPFDDEEVESDPSLDEAYLESDESSWDEDKYFEYLGAFKEV